MQQVARSLGYWRVDGSPSPESKCEIHYFEVFTTDVLKEERKGILRLDFLVIDSNRLQFHLGICDQISMH